MTALSFSFTPLVLGYVAGVGVVLVILIQTARIKFKRKFHEIFLISGVDMLLYLITGIWQVSSGDVQTYLIALFPWFIFALLLFPLITHFIMQFVCPRLSTVQKLTIIVVYASAVLLLAGAFLNVGIFSIRTAVKTQIGWSIVIPFEGYALYNLYFALVSFVAVGYLLRYYIALESPLLKSQTGYLLVGLLVPIIGAIAPQSLGPLVPPPFDWLTDPAGLGLILIGLQKHGFLTASPSAEEQSSSPPKYDLIAGLSYLVLDTEPKRIFEIFDDLIEHGHYGLCITRIFPDTVRKEHGIQTAPIRWLTGSKRDDAIAPTDLLGLALTIQSFLENAESPVVLLHGLEYLIFNNGFKPILRMIHQLSEVNAQKQGIFLLPLVSSSVTERQKAMLKAECKPVEPTELGIKAWLRGTSRS